jgi:hypothetical protein
MRQRVSAGMPWQLDSKSNVLTHSRECDSGSEIRGRCGIRSKVIWISIGGNAELPLAGFWQFQSETGHNCGCTGRSGSRYPQAILCGSNERVATPVISRSLRHSGLKPCESVKV